MKPDVLSEQIRGLYGYVQMLRNYFEVHSWCRQQTNYDSEYIADINSKLMSLCNKVYELTQADVAYYEPLIKTLGGEPLELSDDWENNLYRNIVHTLAETENMIPGGQAERVMKVCKALYEPIIQQRIGEIFETLERWSINGWFGWDITRNKSYQSLKSKYLEEVKHEGSS